MYASGGTSASAWRTPATPTDGFTHTCRRVVLIARRRGNVQPNYERPRCGEAAFQHSAAVIKRDALKGRQAFQFTAVASWTASTHLDRSGALFLPAPLAHWVSPALCFFLVSFFLSESLSATFHLGVCSVSPPPPSSPPPLASPFLSAEASHQSR